MEKIIGTVVVTLIILVEVRISHLVVPGTVSNLRDATEIGIHSMNHPNVEEAMKSKIDWEGILSSAQTQTTNMIGTAGMPRTDMSVEITMVEGIGYAKRVVGGRMIPDQMEIVNRTTTLVMMEELMLVTSDTAPVTMMVSLLISVTVVQVKGMVVGTLGLEIMAVMVAEAGTLMNHPATINTVGVVEKRRRPDTDTKAMAIMTCANRLAGTLSLTGTEARNWMRRNDHWSNHQTGATISSPHIRSVALRNTLFRQ